MRGMPRSDEAFPTGVLMLSSLETVRITIYRQASSPGYHGTFQKCLWNCDDRNDSTITQAAVQPWSTTTARFAAMFATGITMFSARLAATTIP